MLSELTEDRKYVLVYWDDAQRQTFYFKEQNLYFGTAILTDDVNHACLMTLQEAIDTWKCMSVKDDWEIWSVKQGLVLEKKETNYRIEEQIADLNKQVAELAAKIVKE